MKVIILLALFIVELTIWIMLPTYKREDVNHDGKVDIHDLLIVQKYIIKENEK